MAGEKLTTQPLPPIGASGLVPAGSAISPSPPAAEVGMPKKCSRCNHRYPDDFLLCPRDGTPLELEGQAGDPFLGRVLGDTYQVLRLVGEGGMGRVYEARHLRLPDRRVAVKILQPEYARDTDICARFQREAEVASSVAHRNVIEVYDVSKTPDGVPYIVCEFLSGEELGARLEHQGADVGYCVHVTRQVCRALAAAHAKGVVHRDMKPENVFLVERDGEAVVKVIDFGISKANQNPGDANLTRTGMVMGTPSYMAPEQARGDKAVDVRADVYAVGALLYHALTGKKPFDSDDPTSTLTLVLTEEPERPRSINTQIPEGLEIVVQRAMAKDARDRYATMADLDRALAPFDTIPGRLPQHSSATLVRKEGGGVAVQGAAQSDPNARTMMVGQAPSAAPPTHSDARYARPTIVLAAIGLVLWLVGGLVDAIGGIIRTFHDGERLSNVELVLVLVGTIAAAITPVALGISRVSKVWANSVKTLELATDLRRTVVVGLATYGTAALAMHLVVNVGLRDQAILRSGLYDAGLFGASVLFAAVAGGVGPIARSIRRGR